MVMGFETEINTLSCHGIDGLLLSLFKKIRLRKAPLLGARKELEAEGYFLTFH